jgi:hypothetical protein
LNRWLRLVKWLLAFPQYILVGALVGSGYVVATSMQDGRAVTYSTPSLIGAAVLIAAIAMLFTTRYSPSLFDLALGKFWASGARGLDHARGMAWRSRPGYSFLL